MNYFAGVDAGSTYVKCAIMDSAMQVAAYGVKPVGINASHSAAELIEELSNKLNTQPSEIQLISTGYSRRMITAAKDTVTEIRAHAAGSLYSAPDDVEVRTIIDIGGQDCKIIQLDHKCEVANFVMNDKCAAGTGRFLEVLARTLQVGVDQLSALSDEAQNPCEINSMCVVFAESEIISLLARGVLPADIIAGVHASFARRVCGMAKKAGITGEVMITGGGALNEGLVRSFEDELMRDIHIGRFPQLNGAIGAAIISSREASAALN